MDDNITSRLMGMMAVEQGLITEKQLRALLNGADFEGRPMMDIAVENEYLTEAQVEKLRRLTNRDASTIEPAIYSKKKFGLLALKAEDATKSQIQDALREQEEFASFGAHFPLGQLLMSKGLLTPEQVTNLLAKQGKRYLQCTDFCDGSDTVRDFSEEKFYRCPKCGSDLELSDIVSVSRTKIEEQVDDLKAKADTGPQKPVPKRKKIKIDLSSVVFDDEDDDELDMDVGDLDVLEL